MDVVPATDRRDSGGSGKRNAHVAARQGPGIDRVVDQKPVLKEQRLSADRDLDVERSTRSQAGNEGTDVGLQEQNLNVRVERVDAIVVRFPPAAAELSVVEWSQAHHHPFRLGDRKLCEDVQPVRPF